MALGNINDFRAALRYGGARSSKFQVIITNPINGAADNTLPLMVRASGLPAWNLNPIEVFHFGRPVKFAGNRTFEDWNVTIINDEDFRARNALEEWSNAINSLEGNTRTTASGEAAAYKSTAEVMQYSQTGQVIRTYKFVGIFPTAIGSIDLDWSNEAVEEFPVTFSYDYFYVSDSVTGNAGGV